MAQQGRGLPAAYQAVEWINGADCDIDLLYVPTVNPKAISKFAITASGDRDVMGFTQNSAPSFIVDCYLRGNMPELTTVWYNRFYSTTRYSLDFQFTSYDDPHVFEFGDAVKVDGITLNTPSNGDWSANTKSFHVFAGRTRHVGVKLYSFMLYDGGFLARDLIPCYRKSDAVIGVYDKISKTFYTSTHGIFTKGQDI